MFHDMGARQCLIAAFDGPPAAGRRIAIADTLGVSSRSLRVTGRKNAAKLVDELCRKLDGVDVRARVACPDARTSAIVALPVIRCGE